MGLYVSTLNVKLRKQDSKYFIMYLLSQLKIERDQLEWSVLIIPALRRQMPEDHESKPTWAVY